MKKLILTLFAALALFGPAHAAGGGVPWDKFPTQRMTDLPALQNGAKLFVNYCLNCHSASFMRYNRLRDIGLTEDQIKNNLIFTGAKVGETMKSSMDAKDAKEWFGALPPDLTLVARSRANGAMGSGADYLYTYLRSYYRDETRPRAGTTWSFRVWACPMRCGNCRASRRPCLPKKGPP
jgi:ubiquinol-cytochrome c reductase cytochrome c1 subunit